MVLVLDVDLKNNRMTMAWVMTLMNVAGSSSPVGSMLPYPRN